jgi:dihydroxy-acid dehydratase
MEDFHHAGNMPALLHELRPLLELAPCDIQNRSMDQRSAAAVVVDRQIIGTLDKPFGPKEPLVILRGSLAPGGAVLKKAAANPALFQHEGTAVVFESPEDAAQRIDDPSLQIQPDQILVLRHAGPKAAGMPEAGSLPIPSYLAKTGVKDMVRISDGRMSGTSYGTVILHIAPEAASGGPLALVENGDRIRVDVLAGRLDLLVDNEELQRRRTLLRLPTALDYGWTGYRRLHFDHVLQADEGCDLDLWSS